MSSFKASLSVPAVSAFVEDGLGGKRSKIDKALAMIMDCVAANDPVCKIVHKQIAVITGASKSTEGVAEMFVDAMLKFADGRINAAKLSLELYKIPGVQEAEEAEFADSGSIAWDGGARKRASKKTTASKKPVAKKPAAKKRGSK